jgi:hypothetical protein
MGRFVPHSNLKGNNWPIWGDSDGYSDESVQRSILLDIRSELEKLNGLLACPSFLHIPDSLRQIARNTRRNRKIKKVKKRSRK